MSIYQFAIMTVYAIAAFIVMERKQLRALAWVTTAASVYIVTSTYWRAGYPEPAFVSGLIDGAACIAIYLFGKYGWELLIWRFFQASILVNIIRLAGTHVPFVPVFDGWIYSLALETLNVLIALTAVGTGFLKREPVDDGNTDWSGRRFHHFVRSLRQERPKPPFWKVPG
jgi:hypothetical protein